MVVLGFETSGAEEPRETVAVFVSGKGYNGAQVQALSKNRHYSLRSEVVIILSPSDMKSGDTG